MRRISFLLKFYSTTVITINQDYKYKGETISVRVLPACILWNGDGNDTVTFQEHWVMGWGKTNNTGSGNITTVGAFSTVLQKVQVPFYNATACKSKYRVYNGLDDEKQVCAGGIQGMY